jgi:hypothetical protein
MRVSVCTRQRYDDDDTFERRMDLARRTCIPAVVAAAELPAVVAAAEIFGASLTWRWRAHERHAPDVWAAVAGAGWPGRIEVVDDFGPETDDVQVTLDSDDRIEPGYLATVMSYWRRGRTELRTWQPIKQRLSDGRLHRHRFRYRVKKRVSPFYAIYNPTEELYAYCASHGKLHELVQPKWMKGPGAIAVIHGDNALMDLRAGDIRLDGGPVEADYR